MREGTVTAAPAGRDGRLRAVVTGVLTSAVSTTAQVPLAPLWAQGGAVSVRFYEITETTNGSSAHLPGQGKLSCRAHVSEESETQSLSHKSHARKPWPLVLAALLALPLAIADQAAGNADDSDNELALALANEARAAVGLPRLLPHPALSQAAKAHAQYLATNWADPRQAGLGQHDEFRDLPGFTGRSSSDRCRGSGAPFGCTEVIYGALDIRGVVDGWLMTMYHRSPFLSNFTYAGFARAGKGAGSHSVMEFAGEGTWPMSPVVWPYPGMTKVRVYFGGETPDPIPGGYDPSLGNGYPISVHGPNLPRFASFRLYDERGAEVPTVQGVSPSRDWTRIPARPLQYGTTYRVTATVSDAAGATQDLSWSFSTVAKPGEVTNLKAEARPGGVLISWSVTPGTISGFGMSLPSAPDPDEFRHIFLPPTARFFLDGGPYAPLGTRGRSWVVVALDQNGESLYRPARVTYPPQASVAPPTGPVVPEWHSQWVRQAPDAILTPGQVTESWVEFVNLGNQPWIKGSWTTEAHLGLSGDDRRPATDWRMNPGSWLALDRLARQEEQTVNPGEIGRFRFGIRAPTVPGTYALNLRPVIDGVTWMEDNAVLLTVTVVQPYHSQWLGQSSYPTIAVGETTTLFVAFRNVGAGAWVKGTASEARLGVNLDDRTFSELGMAVGWALPDRPAMQSEPYVGPGGTATFVFRVKGVKTGQYTLHLRPVIDGVTWMEDEGVFLVVTVR